MNSINYLYISLNIISFAAIIAIITVATGKIDKKGSKELLLLLVFILIASVTSLIESLYTEFSTQLLWRNLSQIGFFLIPSASFNFIMIYTNSKNRFVLSLRILFFLYAFLCVLLIFTNDLHHIMRLSVVLKENGRLTVQQSIFGMIAVSFNTLISLSGLVRLWIFLMHSSRSNRKQILLVFIGFFLPVLLTYTRSSLSGLIGFNIPASSSFLIGIIFILIGMFRYNFLSISPLVREWVIDEISLGMVFVDMEGMIADKNEYAKSLFWNIEEVIAKNKDWKTAINNAEDKSLEIQVDSSYYSIKVHNLLKKGRSLGSVSLIQDITDERKYQQELAYKAEMDGMTQIYNRESFVSKVKNSLSNLRDSFCCLILIDIDQFKSINDTFGHSMGDLVIKDIVTILNNSTRDSDLVGRLGGDEFVIFIPAANHLSIKTLTSRIEKTLSAHPFKYHEETFTATVSMGATICPGTALDFEGLYEAADQALYKAKKNGRAQTVIMKT